MFVKGYIMSCDLIKDKKKKKNSLVDQNLNNRKDGPIYKIISWGILFLVNYLSFSSFLIMVYSSFEGSCLFS